MMIQALRKVIKYRVPCDHVPIRSWPLFKAKDVMRGVLHPFKVKKAA